MQQRDDDHNHQSKTAPSKGRFVTPPPHTHKRQEGKLGHLDSAYFVGTRKMKRMWMRNPHCGWGWGMREAGIRSWGGHWGDLQPQICRGPGPKSSKLPLLTEWGSSLYHLLTCCSVNLSSSPRPKTSELRGSSLCHHLLTLVNFYQPAALVNFESGPRV